MHKGKTGNEASPVVRARLRRLVKSSSVPFLAMLCCTGCSFWTFKGGGPVPKDTAYRLHGRAPWTMSDGEKQTYDHRFGTAFWDGIPKETFLLRGGQATFKQRTTRYLTFMPILGYWSTESLLLRDKKEGTERMVGRGGAFLPAFPLAVLSCTLWDTWYSVDRREELATRKCIGLGPAGLLFGYTRAVQPADMPQVAGNIYYAGPATHGRYLAAVTATKGEETRYNSQWAWHIAAGAIAWGRVNYNYVLQVAWIPISLWRIRE